MALVVKRGNMFVVIGKNTRDVLGRHKTRKAAEKQAAAVRISTARQRGAKIPKRKASSRK